MSDQISFLSDLDRASDTRKANLCKTWKNAIMNDFDVFVENRVGKLHLEGKNRGEWSYLCDDFVKCETVEQHEIKRAGLMKYASYKQMEKCAECGKKWRWLYGDICGVCYEKKRKKADEIARGFKAEGWKEVPSEDEQPTAKNRCKYYEPKEAF